MLMKLCYNIIGNRVKIHFLHFTMVSSFMTNIYKYTLKFDNILPFIYWCLEFLFIECFALVPIYTCHYYWVSLTKTYQINTTHLISQSNKQPHVWSLIKFFLRVLDEVLCKLHSACYIGRSKWKTKVMTQFLFVMLIFISSDMLNKALGGLSKFKNEDCLYAVGIIDLFFEIPQKYPVWH